MIVCVCVQKDTKLSWNIPDETAQPVRNYGPDLSGTVVSESVC